MPAALSQGTVIPARTLRLGVWHPSPESVASASSSSTADPTPWQSEWRLQRHALLAQRPLGLSLRVVAVLCLLILVAVWTVAKRFALPVACSELLALGAVMLFCVRHAADHDFIGLRPDVLTVELRRAGRVSRWDFSPRWVRVEPRTADGSLVRLSGHGKTVDVGRFVSPVLRQQLASELRWALRQVSRDARDGSNR